MNIRPGKDSVRADHFPSPSVPPTITQTTSQAQLRVYFRCETEARVLRLDTGVRMPILWPIMHMVNAQNWLRVQVLAVICSKTGRSTEIFAGFRLARAVRAASAYVKAWLSSARIVAMF
jgi:hypothetical protein